MVLFVHLRAPVHFTDVLKGIKIFHIYIKTLLQMKKKAQENKKTDISLLEAKISAPPTVQEQGATKPWAKRVRQEICAFLILSNIMVLLCFMNLF